MVNFPPLAPSVGWFAEFIKQFSSTGDKTTAIRLANLKLRNSKEFGRCLLSDQKGEFKILSMAVEGGGRKLRDYKNLNNLKLSEHGDWRKVHVRTIEAILGRKPFFRDIERDLNEVYENKDLLSLEAFNTAIFELIFSFLMGNIGVSSLSQAAKNPVIIDRSEEIGRCLRREETVLQLLATYGKEALLGVMAFIDD